MDKLSHRRAAGRIAVKDSSGTPVANRDIHATLVNHKFHFACSATQFIPLGSPDAPEEIKQAKQKEWDAWRALFNLGIFHFYQGRYEPTPEQTMEKDMLCGARFINENGFVGKGHPLCWHTVDARWLMDMDNDAVLANQCHRIRREMTAFKGLIKYWDVINEAVIMPEFDKTENAITRLCQHMGRVPLIKALFETAREADPDAKLLINDFNTSERYRQLIEDCLAAGVRPDIIGIQSHQHQGPWGLEKLHEVVERFERFGIPLHFTENTFVSGHLMPKEIVDLNDYQIPEWRTTAEGEDKQAQWLLEMVDFLFERPSVHAYSNWDFVDGGWLGAPAGLLRADGTPKPAYYALHDRIHKDWHTDVVIHTDSEGCATLEGFMGKYKLETAGAEAFVTLDTDTDCGVVLG